jgi:hypothetical protein
MTMQCGRISQPQRRACPPQHGSDGLRRLDVERCSVELLAEVKPKSWYCGISSTSCSSGWFTRRTRRLLRWFRRLPFNNSMHFLFLAMDAGGCGGLR